MAANQHATNSALSGSSGPSTILHKPVQTDPCVRMMEVVIAFNQENAARVMPYVGREHMEITLLKGPLTSKRYRKAWNEPTLIRRAYASEPATNARRPPRFAAHAVDGEGR
jgi:hypothetical protein